MDGRGRSEKVCKFFLSISLEERMQMWGRGELCCSYIVYVSDLVKGMGEFHFRDEHHLWL